MWLERVIAGERACLRLAERLELRARLCTGASLRKRVGLVARLYHDGACAADGGFGSSREALVEDFAVGIFSRRLLVAHGPGVAADGSI